MRDALSRAFAAAAEALAAGPSARWPAEACDLLRFLGIADPADVERDRDLARLVAIAARLERLFAIPVPDAPGLACFGAQVNTDAFDVPQAHRACVSGVGADRLAALRACVAEAAEFVCQFARVDEPRASAVACDLPDEALAAAWCDLGQDQGEGDGEAGDGSPRVAARPFEGGAPVGLPAGLCWRNVEGDAGLRPAFAPGLGVAAGVDPRTASQRAVLEWIERDAVALWWRGGRRARSVVLERLVDAGIPERMQAYRGGLRNRRTWFLDLTTEVAVPVVAALSCGPDGRGFAYGFAARLTLEEALRAAFEELLQIELADRLVAAKRAEGGDDALNAVDRRHLERRDTVTDAWEILHPSRIADAVPGTGDDPARDRDAEESSTDPATVLARRLHASGCRAHVVDLTREDLGVPVMRAIVTGLQPDPSPRVSARLQRQRDAGTKGGTTATIAGDRVRLY
ncbi:YcaO-like family protein [Stappia sp.]|uniref:YcaO-like family protein n=1 Tax=Stappia sp. TaxID=1870903 RepID=UPI0032D94CF9